ncbi:MAG: hypothetical protein DCF15_20775 [Phormidesmis priestleyi]|uniref:Uncharacterized protein n=1 Tax=Phormidesmis priestleyi TaxID=268141 RepID=A0A2W4WLT1_9CYAN|nr:MAG: hypothetical protein DCF15_20775 [Phormidesmis priestleyi]
MDSELGRLSEEQWQLAHHKALSFRDRLVKQAVNKATGNTVFYPELFRIAAELIEKDADAFCDRAQAMFDEIDAYGQEPTLDDDWLAEVTGEKDSFYFSTDSLVTQMPSLSGKKRGKKPNQLGEADVIKAVEEAIVSIEETISVAHQEDPTRWILRIHSALESEHGCATFGKLMKKTSLSPGALFLGLLLGHDHWHLTQNSFYGQVVVTLVSA